MQITQNRASTFSMGGIRQMLFEERRKEFAALQRLHPRGEHVVIFLGSYWDVSITHDVTNHWTDLSKIRLGVRR